MLKVLTFFMRYFLILFFSLAIVHVEAQGSFQVAFYNVENLFDTTHASYKDDYEFLPNGKREWSTVKYRLKQYQTARVILGVGDWQGPDAIGLCEIENKNVLQDLILQTGLKNFGYNYIHYESDDVRGIDVAFLYKKDKFYPLVDSVVTVDVPGDRPTRDILYVCGKHEKDTLHFFVNHWSSRWGGKTESEPKRLNAAEVLMESVKELKDSLPLAKVIVMGDFNDTPDDRSLLMLKEDFVNCSRESSSALGTIKYQNQWTVFDQILVSENLSSVKESFRIYNPEWLYMEDPVYAGKAPYRSFKGDEFLGGYSDHFPVYITIGLGSQ